MIDYVDIDNFTFKLVKADETGLDMDLADDAIIPDGDYKAYDVMGRFVKNVLVQNARCEDLKAGFYVLVSEEGRSFSMLIGK